MKFQDFKVQRAPLVTVSLCLTRRIILLAIVLTIIAVGAAASSYSLLYPQAAEAQEIADETSSASNNSGYAIGVVTQLPVGANYPLYSEYPSGSLFVRMRISDTGISWTSPNENAQQILSMISQLHPQVLERMTAGPFNTNWDVPVCSGCQPMKYGQFLNASMDACQCYIIPRLDINDTWDEGTFLTDAKSILSESVYPRFSMLSIDNWGPFCSMHGCGCVFDQQVFQNLYAMGWRGVGVLADGGDYVNTCGWATFVDFGISVNGWQINPKLFASIKEDQTVQKILLYAPDFPTPAQALQSTCASSTGSTYYGCDQVAAVITYAAENQALLGYSYVYPIEQTNWDATRMLTSNNTSIYDVILNLTKDYNGNLGTELTSTEASSTGYNKSNSSNSEGVSSLGSLATFTSGSQTETSVSNGSVELTSDSSASSGRSIVSAADASALVLMSVIVASVIFLLFSKRRI